MYVKLLSCASHAVNTWCSLYSALLLSLLSLRAPPDGTEQGDQRLAKTLAHHRAPLWQPRETEAYAMN